MTSGAPGFMFKTGLAVPLFRAEKNALVNTQKVLSQSPANIKCSIDTLLLLCSK